MIGELEPGPDPNKSRNPRHPAEPPRIAEVLRSYHEDRQFSIPCSTYEEALDVKRQLTRSVYHLNLWHENPATGKKWDIRVRPWLSEHWDNGDGERTLYKGMSAPPGAEIYWKVNFHAHDPKDQGFRRMSKDQMEAAHRKSAQSRGVALPRTRRRRVVEQTAD